MLVLCFIRILIHEAKVQLLPLLAVYNMGVSNTGGMMHMQQQQQLGSQGAFGNMQPNAQNLQSSMAALQNVSQNHPNFAQQRQQNQQP